MVWEGLPGGATHLQGCAGQPCTGGFACGATYQKEYADQIPNNAAIALRKPTFEASQIDDVMKAPGLTSSEDKMES